MAKYRITDPSSGRSVVVSGDTPPTPEDAAEIFKTTGVSGSTAPKNPTNETTTATSNPTAAPVQEQPAEPKSVGGFLQNIPKSGIGLVKGLAEAGINAFNPDLEKNTIANIVRLPFGLGEKIGAAINNDPNYKSGNTARVDALGDFYKKRYGGVNNVADTAYNDPLGFLLDVTSLLDAGASAVGKVGEISKVSSLTKAADTASNVARAIDPIAQATKFATKSVPGVVSKLEAPFAGGYRSDIDALAKELGVELPVSAKTTNRFVKSGEAVAERGTMFGQKITDTIMTARKQLDDRVRALTSKVAQEPDFGNAGKIIKQGFEDVTANFNKQKGEMYDHIAQEMGNAPATFDKTIATIKEIADRKGQSLTGDTNIKYYTDLAKEIEKRGTSYENLKVTRTQVGEKLHNFADPVATGDKAALNQLYASLSEDLDQTIRNNKPELAAEIDKVNAYYKDGITKINGSIGKKIANSDPEKLVDQLIKPNSETAIKTIKEVISEEAFHSLQESFLSKIFKKSIGKDGMLDIRKFETQMSNYGEATLKKLLNPDQLQRLTDVRTELNKVGTLKGAIRNPAAEGSQTAFNVGNIAGMVPVLAMNPLLAAKIVAGQWLGAKAFTSDFGRQFLTKGFNVTEPVRKATEAFGNKVSGTGAALNIPSDLNESMAAMRRLQEKQQKK